MIHDVVNAEYLDGYQIKVTFVTGRAGIVDRALFDMCHLTPSSRT